MSKLFIVPTPIGNLEDISLRAIRILKEVDLILAEDTRKSGILLNHLNIETKMKSHHQFNEHKSIDKIIDEISSGKKIAMVSDAGTPGISDPGFLLIRECIKNDIHVESLPGATALIPALVNSGLPSDRFTFEGFLPQKKGKKTRMELLTQSTHTMIFYESPFRLLKTIDLFIEFFGPQRLATVSRELTKIHEETIRGTLQEIKEFYVDKKIKGEIVIVVQGKS